MRVDRPERVACALVSLGSNIAPRKHLAAALEALAERCDVVAVSGVWRSRSVGAAGPDFLNAAAMVRTPLDAVRFKFHVLRPIEERLGRVRTADRNAPRTIDLDLAVFGEGPLDVPDGHGGRLRLPDPDIARHAHVALPLADIAAALRLPGDGRRLAEIAAAAMRADASAGRTAPIRVADLDRRAPAAILSGAR